MLTLCKIQKNAISKIILIKLIEMSIQYFTYFFMIKNNIYVYFQYIVGFTIICVEIKMKYFFSVICIILFSMC